MIVAPAGGAVSGFSLVVRTLIAASKRTSQILRSWTAPLTVMRLPAPQSAIFDLNDLMRCNLKLFCNGFPANSAEIILPHKILFFI